MSNKTDVSNAGQKLLYEEGQLLVCANQSDYKNYPDFAQAVSAFDEAAKAFRKSIGEKDMVKKAQAYSTAANNFRVELEKIHKIPPACENHLGYESRREFINTVRAFTA